MYLLLFIKKVFIKISQMDSSREYNSKQLDTNKTPTKDFLPLESQDVEIGTAEGAPFAAVNFNKLSDDQNLQFFICHMKAMINKRAYYFMRDKKTWIYQYIIPVLFVLVGMLIVYYNTIRPDQPFKAIRTSNYNKGISTNKLPLPYSNAASFCAWGETNNCSSISGQQAIMQNIPGSSNFPLRPLNDAIVVKNVSSSLFSKRKDYQASTFGAVSFINYVKNNNNDLKEMKYYIHANYSAAHASHLFNTLVVDAAIKTYNSSYSLNMNLHTLPNTYKQKTTFSSYNTALVVTFILLAAPCIPAAFATFVVRERETKSKQQQVI